MSLERPDIVPPESDDLEHCEGETQQHEYDFATEAPETSEVASENPSEPLRSDAALYGTERDDSNGAAYFVKTALLILAVALLRWLTAGRVGLGDSEAYYYTWSRHLELSYFDHPPLVAWLIRLSTAYLGDSVFAVRMPSIMLSAAATFLIYLSGAGVLASSKAGFYAALLFSFCHVFFLGGMAAAPDVALIFFWLLAFLLLHEAVKYERGLFLVFSAAAVGLALLTKYNAALFVPAALVYLLTTPGGRKLLFSRWILISAAVALAVFAPVLVWNYQHDWVSFRFHLIDRHGGADFSWRNLLIFSGGQLLYYSPLIWIILLFSAAWLAFNVFSRKIPAAAFVFIFSLPLLIFFFFIGAWTPESEPHWSAVAYLPLFALAGLFLSRRSFRSFSQRFMQLALALAIFVNIGLLVHILSNPFVDAWPEDSYRPKLDISNELYGWGKAADEMARLLRENRSLAFAASYHYTMCGQLEFALKGALPVYCPNHRRDAFDFLPDSAMPPVGRDGLIVTDNRYDREPRELYRCADMEDVARLDITRGSKKVRTFRFTVCRGFRDIQAEDYKYAPLPAPEPTPEPILPPADEAPLAAGPLVEMPELVAPQPDAVQAPSEPVQENAGADEAKQVPVPDTQPKAPEGPADAMPQADGDEVPEPEMLEI